MLKIIPNKKNIGAEIIVNLKDITNKDILKIKKALNKYGMLYFKQQELTSKFYIQFAKYFGKLANYPRLKGLNKKFPQITVVQRKSTDKGPYRLHLYKKATKIYNVAFKTCAKKRKGQYRILFSISCL
jgi:taurine dioxygenase